MKGVFDDPRKEVKHDDDDEDKGENGEKRSESANQASNTKQPHSAPF